MYVVCCIIVYDTNNDRMMMCVWVMSDVCLSSFFVRFDLFIVLPSWQGYNPNTMMWRVQNYLLYVDHLFSSHFWVLQIILIKLWWIIIIILTRLIMTTMINLDQQTTINYQKITRCLFLLLILVYAWSKNSSSVSSIT